MTSMAELRLALIKQDPIYSGKFGESKAKQWFDQSDWVYEEVNQQKNNLSKTLNSFGGKRPDFIIDTTEFEQPTILLVDAKFVSTNGGKHFTMKQEEIDKYLALKTYMKIEFPNDICEILFIIFPKEDDGNKLVWVELSELNSGSTTKIHGKPAKRITLTDRGDLWYSVN